MGFFSKRNADGVIPEKNEELLVEDEVKTEVEDIQNGSSEKHEELNTITEKIHIVKEEYNTVVSDLMLIKKELNQKKMEVDIAQR